MRLRNDTYRVFLVNLKSDSFFKSLMCIDTLRLRQNGHLPDDIFKCIFLDEHVEISMTKISLEFVPKEAII